MKTIKLLTIGNSFADNPLTYLSDLVASAGMRLVVGRANIGGCPLHKHWNLATYTAQHPEQKTYDQGVGPDGKQRQVHLQDALAAERWDLVTLQQASVLGWQRESFQPYLGLLHGLVRQRAPQAEILLNQTWAYRGDAPFLVENGLTEEDMFARNQANYAHFAAELGCRVIPAGAAIQQARRAAGRTFVWPDPAFDYQNAKAPALPRQEHSLSAGWFWAFDTPDGLPELRLDPNHLNAHGCYLTGCAWFEIVTGVDVRTATFVPPEVDAASAAFYRATAHDVCARPERARGASAES